MSKIRTLPELGRIVEVTRGRDRGTVCVVVGHETDRFVYVADGHVRKMERPKRKNLLHIRATPHLAHEVLAELRTHGKVTNAILRHVLRLYQGASDGTEAQIRVEGGVSNGEG